MQYLFFNLDIVSNKSIQFKYFNKIFISQKKTKKTLIELEIKIMSSKENIKKLLTELTSDEENLKELKYNILRLDYVIKEIMENTKESSLRYVFKILNLILENLGFSFALFLNESELLKKIGSLLKKKEILEKYEKYVREMLTLVFQFSNDLKLPQLANFANFAIDIKFELDPNKKKEFNIFEKNYLEILSQINETQLAIEEFNKDYRRLNHGKSLKLFYENLSKINVASLIIDESFAPLEISLLSKLFPRIKELLQTLITFDSQFIVPATNQLINQKKNPKELKNKNYFFFNETIQDNNDEENEFYAYLPYFEQLEFFDLRKTICAFLNTNGGRIYFGIEHASVHGTPLNKTEQDSIKREIDELLKGFNPKVELGECTCLFLPIFNKERRDRKQNYCIIKVIVKQGIQNDLYFTKDRVAYLRVGSKNVVINNFQEEIQKRMSFSKYIENRDEKFNDPEPLDIEHLDHFPEDEESGNEHFHNQPNFKKFSFPTVRNNSNNSQNPPQLNKPLNILNNDDSSPFKETKILNSEANKSNEEEKVLMKPNIKKNQLTEKQKIQKDIKEYIGKQSDYPPNNMDGKDEQLKNLIFFVVSGKCDDSDFNEYCQTIVCTYKTLKNTSKIKNIYIFAQKKKFYLELNAPEEIVKQLKSITEGVKDGFLDYGWKGEYEKFKKKYVI